MLPHRFVRPLTPAESRRIEDQAFEELNRSENHDLTLRFPDPLGKDLPEAA
jgi:hypothetical protein